MTSPLAARRARLLTTVTRAAIRVAPAGNGRVLLLATLPGGEPRIAPSGTTFFAIATTNEGVATVHRQVGNAAPTVLLTTPAITGGAQFYPVAPQALVARLPHDPAEDVLDPRGRHLLP